MTPTYLTPAEVAAIQRLPRDTPYLINNVMHGMLSIARHYGGCTYQGVHYDYIPATDELVRDDVMRFVAALRKLEKKVARTIAREKQMDLT